MLSFFSSIERIIIAVLVACVIFVSYVSYNTHRNYTASQITIENQALQLENLAIQEEFLIQSVNLSEQSNALLLKERDSLSLINARYSQRVDELNKQFSTAQLEITNLRRSHDETIKKWATHCVPFSALRLLTNVRAENCHTNSGTDEVPVHITPEKPY